MADELGNAKETEVWSEKTLENNPDCGLERTKVLVTLQGERLGSGSTADGTELFQKRQTSFNCNFQSSKHRAGKTSHSKALAGSQCQASGPTALISVRKHPENTINLDLC